MTKQSQFSNPIIFSTLLYTSLYTLICLAQTTLQFSNTCSKKTILKRDFYQGQIQGFQYLLHLSEKNKAAPLIIYLRGDFGLGSSYVSFQGIGPYIYDSSIDKVVLNSGSYLSEFYQVLLVDFPSDTGLVTLGQSGELADFKDNLADLSLQMADFISHFLEFKNDNCQLTAFTTLDIYLMSEGFGAPLALKTADLLLNLKENSFNVTGFILQDPIINFSRQMNNYGAYGLGRGVIDGEGNQDINRVETAFQMNDQLTPKNSNQFSLLINKIYQKSSQIAAWNISQPIKPNSDKVEDIFMGMPGEDDIGTNSNFAKLLKSTLNMKYVKTTAALLKKFNIFPNFQIKKDKKTRERVKEGEKLKEGQEVIQEEQAMKELFVQFLTTHRILITQSQDNMIANPISLMMFLDSLNNWKEGNAFQITKSYFIDTAPQKNDSKLNLKLFGNFWMATLFGVGYRGFYQNLDMVMSKLLDPFVAKVSEQVWVKKYK